MELLAAVLGFILVSVIVYGPHVIHGGFYSDDWANSARYQLEGYGASVRFLETDLGGRPLLAVLLPVPHALFGQNIDLQLGLGLVLAVITAACLFVALRAFGLRAIHSFGIALLSLVFPWADSLRLWATASLNSLAVALYLLGFTAAIAGLRRSGRLSLALHGVAVSLYLASVLTYEVAAAAALLTGFVYVARAPRRKALTRWAVDVVVVGGALIYELVATIGVRQVGSFTDRISDVPYFVRASFSLLGMAVFPAGTSSVHKAVGLVLVALVILLGFVRARRGDEATLRSWLIRVIAFALVAAAAYFMFLGSGLNPLSAGIRNRVNVFALVGYAGLTYAVIIIGARVVVRNRRVSNVIAVAALAAIAAGWSVRVRDDAAKWQRAWRVQETVLAKLSQALPSLPRGSTVVSFGVPGYVASEVPVFEAEWDLDGAVKLRYRDRSLHAYPVYGESHIRCGHDTVEISVSKGQPFDKVARYGTLFFVDAPHGWAQRIGGPSSCLAALRIYRPGPAVAAPGSGL